VDYIITGEARYLLERLRWELARGLMGHEQLSPTYGEAHVAPMGLLWWESWRRGDEEVCRLAGAWLERMMLLQCLCGIPGPHGELVPRAPGMRADVRSVTEGGKMVSSHLLGRPYPFDLDHSTFWGPLLHATQEAEGVERSVERVGPAARRLLRDKEFRHEDVRALQPLRQARLLVPIRFHSWPDGSWFAWIPESRGSQDPPCMGAGVLRGVHAYLWPFKGEDPPEGGWRAHAEHAMGAVASTWFRHGRGVADARVHLPDASPPEIIGGPDGPDPLGGLPPMPDPREHPRAGGWGKPPTPEPPRMIPRWLVRSWLEDPPTPEVADLVAEIIWQAQRQRDGEAEPDPREILETYVDRLREEVR